MSTITPHLWFDTQAAEAAAFYASVFPDSAVTVNTTLQDTPGGDTEMVAFRLWGQDFMAISAGPMFTFSPAISFIVNVDPSRVDDAPGLLDELWARLGEGGQVLLELGAYPFSDKYGWVQDRFGLSWQLILTDPAGDPRPPILPSLLFVGDVAGRAEEASELYLSLFADSQRGQLVRWPEGAGAEVPGTVMFSDFRLGDSWLTAMDSADPRHQFGFTEAVSMLVRCTDQAEIDRYWQALSAVPEAEQCGWLKDRFGVSWQIVPAALDRMFAEGTPEQVTRVTEAFMPMKKLDLAALERAYAGDTPDLSR
jgi:predicted 3-demethylubiquinone-9 3-methyltransferase (glyoxalase superfamily)